MARKAIKMQVTERAVIQRINRKLANDQKRLRATRGEHWRSNYGNYCIVNFVNGTIPADHVDPEKLARQLDVLQPYEEMVRA